MKRPGPNPPMLLSAPRVYVCYASCDYPIHHPIIRVMYTHRISGVAHGVNRYCYLFLDRLLQARLGLEDAQPHIPCCPSYRDGDCLLILMSFVTLSSLARTPEGWAPALVDPHYGFPYLSRVGHLIFKATINAGRSCDNNGRFRKNISSTREVVRGIAESA